MQMAVCASLSCLGCDLLGFGCTSHFCQVDNRQLGASVFLYRHFNYEKKIKKESTFCSPVVAASWSQVSCMAAVYVVHLVSVDLSLYRLLYHEWQDGNTEHLKFQARMLSNSAPKCLATWKM